MAILRSPSLVRRVVGYAGAVLLGLVAGVVAAVVAAAVAAAPSAAASAPSGLASLPPAASLPSASASTDCQPTVLIAAQWPTGFVANVTLTNVGSRTWQQWTATIIMPPGYQIVSVWNVRAAVVGLQNVFSGIGPVPPGGSVTFGFVAAGSGPIGPIQVICSGF